MSGALKHRIFGHGMKTKRTNSPAKTRKASPSGKVSGKPENTALNVVENTSAQHEEAIARTAELVDPPMARRPVRVVKNTSAQAEEDILQTAAASNVPRLSNGFKIRQNRAYQRVQKIKRPKLTVPASDEMGYKKLFTKFEEGFLAQDLKMIGECLSPAFQWRLPNGDVVYGKKEALEEMDRRFASPNGPKFSKSIWRFEGQTVLQSYEVEYLGPDSRWRPSKGFDLYEIGDGLITLKDAYWKMIP